MKVYPDDMEAIYKAINKGVLNPSNYEARDQAIADALLKVYERGYVMGRREGSQVLRDWAELFGSTPIQQAISLIIQEAADRVNML